MWLRVVCPGCRNKVAVDVKASVATVLCPHCQRSFYPPNPNAGMATGPLPMKTVNRQPTTDEGMASESAEKICPGCGQNTPDAAVLCVKCGWDFRIGKRIGKTAVAPSSVRSSRSQRIHSALMTALMIAILFGGIWAWRYAFKEEKLGDRIEDAFSPTVTRCNASKAPASRPQPEPEQVSFSRLVVRNRRFPKMTVLLGGKELGEAVIGQETVFQIPLPRLTGRSSGGREPPKSVTFSVYPRPSDALRATLERGISFVGTAKIGMEIEIPGLPEDILPKPDTAFRDINWLKAKSLPEGEMGLPEIIYKNRTLKPLESNGVLRFRAPVSGKLDRLFWIDQECLVEENGKIVYDSSRFEPMTREFPFIAP
jgi:hypothetical protein